MLKERLNNKSNDINSKLVEANENIKPFIGKSFFVDIKNYENIKNISSFNAALKKSREKIEGEKVYGANWLIDNRFSNIDLTVRDGSPAFVRYTAAKHACEKIKVLSCKSNFMGILDGVWSNSNQFSGWISYEQFDLVPFDADHFKKSVYESAKISVMKLIREKKGNVDLHDIDAEISRVISSINS